MARPKQQMPNMDLVQETSTPGVYLVQWGSCPRRLIDTCMPEGPEAEAVARSHYRAEYSLVRECCVPSLMLVEG